MLERSLESLRKEGYRITPVRRAILETLIVTKKPLAVENILASLSKKGLRPNKTTVYRELGMLAEEGLVIEVRLASDRRMYEATSSGHHHHLICTACERIEDVEMKEDLHAHERKIGRDTSFRVTGHSLEFFGLCKKCQ